jgi:2-hydroxychromene-2-carboxylate isomerase
MKNLPESNEPVAWIRRHPNGALSNEVLIHVQVEPVRRESGAWVPLYTSPPQRQPLTYVDLRRVANQCGLGANEVSAQAQDKVDNFARAIEAAHNITKEKA